MRSKSLQSLELFYCYAREDRALLNTLDRHLTGLRRSGLITTWYDGEIIPGTPWQQEIEMHLKNADVILLLLSVDFISSDYCFSKEMKYAIERHYTGEARVIPILLRPIHYTSAPFNVLQMLPSNGVPVTSWPNHDEAFANVALGISNVVKDLLSQRSAPLPKKYCGHCGHLLSPLVTVCDVCGTSTEKENPEGFTAISQQDEDTMVIPLIQQQNKIGIWRPPSRIRRLAVGLSAIVFFLVVMMLFFLSRGFPNLNPESDITVTKGVTATETPSGCYSQKHHVGPFLVPVGEKEPKRTTTYVVEATSSCADINFKPEQNNNQIQVRVVFLDRNTGKDIRSGLWQKLSGTDWIVLASSIKRETHYVLEFSAISGSEIVEGDVAG